MYIMKAKATKLFLYAMLLFWTSVAMSQNTNERNRKENEKSEILKTTDKVKQTSSETKEAVSTTKETLNDAKVLVADIGSIFKSEKDKTKKTITITLNNVEYGNADLITLQKAVKKAKNVKSITKQYNNNTATLLIVYKNSADELLQSIPTNITSKFKISSIEDGSIFIVLKSEENSFDNDN